MSASPREISVDELKARWRQLGDVERALAVHALHGAKLSFRKLAGMLACSPSQ